MQHDIGIWFLLLSLFVPRITLFFWWLCGNLPYNTTSFVVDFFAVIAAILVPRVLILVYIYGCQGLSPWFWIHLVALFLAWGWNVITLKGMADKKSRS